MVGPLGFEPKIACAPGMYPILEGKQWEAFLYPC